MVDIQSKEVIDKISEELKIQPAMKIPRELMDKIQLIYSVNPQRLIQKAIGSVIDATSGAVHTTSSTRDTYLIGISLTSARSALAVSIFSSIRAAFFGAAIDTIFMVRYEPLTAGSFSDGLTFPIPIKLERNSAITVTNSAATASIDTTGTIYFYEVDPQ